LRHHKAARSTRRRAIFNSLTRARDGPPSDQPLCRSLGMNDMLMAKTAAE
jgi:hypothetical protein